MFREKSKILSIVIFLCLLATALFPIGASAKQVNGINYYAVDPIAYYTFDNEDIGADTYGSYHLTNPGYATIVDGRSGKGVSFNMDHLYSPFLYNSELLEGKMDFTISVDAKLNDGVTTDNHCIWSNGWQDQGGLSFGFSSNEYMFICADVTGGDWIAFNIASALNDDTFSAYEWHNFTLTLKNGIQLAVYIDGEMVYSITFSEAVNTINSEYPFAIGTTHNGGYPFLGSIDNVKIFDKGFTGNQVAELYIDGKTYTSAITEPIARYTFDSDDIGADTFGNYPLEDRGYVTVVDGNSENGVHFDNTHLFNTFLYNTADPIKDKRDFTVSAFAKLDAGVTDWQCLFSNGWQGSGGLSAGYNIDGWVFVAADAGCDWISFNIANELGDTSFSVLDWHNYTLTLKNGIQLSFYVDSILVYTTTFTSALVPSAYGSPFTIGTTYNGGYPFGGTIDTVNIYDFALNSSQIGTVMEGKELMDDGPILPEATYNFDCINVYTDATGNHDMSSETSVTVAEGYNGKAGVFSGTGWMDNLNGTADFTDSLTEISISMFAKQDDTEGNRCLFSTGWDWAGNERAGFSLGLSDGYLFYNGELTDDSGVWRTIYSNVDTTEWHHYGMSISNGGKTLTLYIDGEKVYTDTFSLPLNLNWVDNRYTYVIGASYARDAYIFSGMIDEVNVYAIGLTDNQMKQAYYCETVQSVLYGDVNNDGIIDIRDLVRLKKVVSKTATASEQLCDVNKDGENNSLDLAALRKTIMDKANKEIIYRDFAVSSAFTDNMVLQRNKKVRIYGVGGEVGSEVTVIFGGQTKTGTVTQNGWQIFLDPMDANNVGSTLTIKNGENKFSYRNVVVGEVFLCSGQSNMARTYDYFYAKDNSIAEDYSKYDNYDNIRVKTISHASATKPMIYTGQKDKWKTYTTLSSAGAVSAYALAFASNMQAMLGNDIPVGVIVAAVDGSSIQLWLDDASLKELNLASDTTSCFYNGMLYGVLGYTVKGFLWYQGCANAHVGGGQIYKELFAKLADEIREQNGDANLPIITTQLVQYDVPWSEFRQAQFEISKEMENVYMVSGIDTGCNIVPQASADAVDAIHPTQKWIIGERAAGIAVSEIYEIAYDDLAIKSSYGDTPYILSATKQDENIVLTVANATSLTSKEVTLGFDSSLENYNGKIGYFEVYNGTGWSEVEATLSGSTVVLTADIENITAVRYLQNGVFADGNSFVYNEYGNILSPIAYVPVN